ncbi:MAG: AAA family ATPase [Romboutsia sp.]
MITYLKLKNFKSFKNVEIDFRDRKGKPKSLICIYGENGSGKSNLAYAFHFLKEVSSTRRWVENLNEIMSDMNSIEGENISIEKIMDILKDKYRNLDDIIAESKLIGSVENMKVEYGLKIDGGEGVYSLELNDKEIIKEELEFKLNARRTVYFSIEKDKNKIINIKLNKSIFNGIQYKADLENEIKKYWGKHSFISIMLYEIQNKNEEYIEENINKKFVDILEFIVEISTKCKMGDTVTRGFVGYESNILANITNGEINKKYLEELHVVEEFLNDVFSTLYSDIKNVYYKIEENEKKDLVYRLMFKKIIAGEIIDIDYNLESTGTLSLLNILPYLVNCCTGKTVIVDEIDMGIHDILFQNVMNSLKKCINGQFIMTTHNTYIMESVLENENIYIIYVDPVGNKEVRCLEDCSDKRIRKTNNMRSRYLKGFYGGTPNADDLDFQFACNDLIKNIERNSQDEV